MTRRLPRLPALLLVAFLLPACGSGADEPAPPATPADQPGTAPDAGGAPELRPDGSVAATALADARATGHADLTFFYVPSSGFAYRDESGELTGVTVELLRDFAAWVEGTEDLHVDVTWVEEPEWAVFYRRVQGSTGGAFGIGNVTITEPRRDELRFSPPYLNNIAVLVTHENVPALGTLEEIGEAFDGMTGLPYPGTLHEERLLAIRDRYLPGMPMREVTSNDELVELLGSGEGYFGYIDVYNYWRARSAGHALRRHGVGDDGSETFGVILPRDSDWGPLMDAFFAADGGYTGSERYHALLVTHLGDELATLLTGEDGSEG